MDSSTKTNLLASHKIKFNANLGSNTLDLTSFQNTQSQGVQSQTKQPQNVQSQKTRLDDYLAQYLDSSKNQILHLIKNGYVKLNAKIAKKGGIILKHNDEIYVTLPTYNQTSHTEYLDFADKMDIEILYEDDDILVLNKPPHLVVHTAPSVKEPTLVDWLKSKHIKLSTLSGEERVGIVHRLDKQTSGSIAIAKNNTAHLALSQQLQTKEMGRYYLAVIDVPLKDRMFVECHLARHPKNRLKITNTDNLKIQIPNTRYSKSEFVPLLESKNSKYQLIAIRLYTGRTHQIRAHLESLSRHIIGDTLYGYLGKDNVRVMLHSYVLHLTHPATRKKLIFCAPMFRDMLQFCFTYFGEEQLHEAIQLDTFLQHFS
ncbi:RluA family pseudouridine synthase [Helicobacter fennelliae]|uniref:RluA family pseudouridine synthase n=1 Tax=Helicobacter fennelliae TaxID=215 RepID=UPI000E07FD1C|nr:RluA family pseudouridine synthase [Helicobacter fennelliae]STQ84336.1 ribosomal pseudouridine synthase [Helicobacter fennelliae]